MGMRVPGEMGTESRAAPAPASPAKASAGQGHHRAETLILTQLLIRHCRDWGKEKGGWGGERGVDKIVVRKKIGLVVPFWP